ncbi:MAG: hypothetical protein KDK99_04040 [Verrucomicrobiales bacterium]|nr:hypothetical protein [Verrucomicrobiales bacterium]
MNYVRPFVDPAVPTQYELACIQAALSFLLRSQPAVFPAPSPSNLADFNSEVANGTYGIKTKLVLKLCRDAFGLTGAITVNVDLANMVNQVLADRGQISRIRGKLLNQRGNGVMGLRIQTLYLFGPDATQPIGTDGESDSQGRYEIFYDFTGAIQANMLKFEVLAGAAGIPVDIEFPIVFWDDNLLDYDLNLVVLDPQFQGDVEYSKIRTKLLGLLHPPSILEITTSDAIAQAPFSGFTPEEIQHWLVTEHLHAFFFRETATPLPIQAVYALVRRNALQYIIWSTPPLAQLATTTDTIAAANGMAADGAAYRTLIEKQLRILGSYCDGWWVRFIYEAEREYWVRTHKDEPQETPDHLLVARAREIPDDTLPEELQKYKLSRSVLTALNVIRARWPRQPDDPNVNDFGTGDVLAPPVNLDPDLVALVAADVLPPLHRSVADAILAEQANAEAVPPWLGFRIVTSDAYKLAVHAHFDGVRTKALLGLQRIVKLKPDPKEVKFLLEADLDSAWRIVCLGWTAFFKRYWECLGDGSPKPTPEARKKAQDLFDNAVAASHQTAHAKGEVHSLTTAHHVSAFISKGDREKFASALEKHHADSIGTVVPTWERLFGSLDSCACEQCQSIHGPASYLVDVLEYFKRLSTGEPEVCDDANGDRPCLCPEPEMDRANVFQILMGRRKDIGYLDLNCANANTPVPYIDLVCELLEEAVTPSTVEVKVSLQEGQIDLNVLNELQVHFPELTSEAEVTLDSFGNWVVRDERIVVLVEKAKGSDKRGIQLAQRLRQTYGSEQEVAAAPEYVNLKALDVLACRSTAGNKKYPPCLELPLDVNRMEAAAYFQGLETSRLEVLRKLEKWPLAEADFPFDSLVNELLGLTPAEAELIAVSDPAHQEHYWSATPEAMSQLRCFLDHTGLKSEPVGMSEFDELMASRFINPCGETLMDVSEDPTDPASRCDTTKRYIKRLTLTGKGKKVKREYTDPLDEDDLDRIHRFLRLWRQLGWPINLLDRLIMSPVVGNKSLDANCLKRLALIIFLAREWGMEPVKAASWYASIAAFGKHPDYARWFLQKLEPDHPFVDPQGNPYLALQPYPPFALDQLCSDEKCPPDGSHCHTRRPDGGWECQIHERQCPTLKEHQDYFAHCIGIATEDVQAVLAYDGKELNGTGLEVDLRLSMNNLSRLKAWFEFSRKLGLRTQEFIKLLKLMAIKNPLGNPTDTRRIWDTVTLMKRWNLKVDDLRFWLLHHADAVEMTKRMIPDFAIGKALGDIRKEFKAIREARAQAEILGTDGMADCLAKLAAVLARIPEKDGQRLEPDQALQISNLLQKRSAKDATDQTLKGLLSLPPVAALFGTTPLPWEAPVDSAGAWIEEDDDLTKITHPAHRAWLIKFVTPLLNAFDAQAREEAVIRLVSGQMHAPAEQVDVILRHCHQPNGHPLLEAFADGEWEVTVSTAPEEVRDAPFAASDAEEAKLTTAGRDFRNAVVNDTSSTVALEPLRAVLTVLFKTVRLGHKIAAFAKALRLDTEHQFKWGLFWQGGVRSRFASLSWFSPEMLSITPSATDAAPQLEQEWKRLLEGLAFLNAYPPQETERDPNLKEGGITALELALTLPDADAAEKVLDVCYRLFGDEEVDMRALGKWLRLTAEHLRQGKTYNGLKEAQDLIRSAGFRIDRLDRFIADDVSRKAVLDLRQCLKRKTDDDAWLDTLKEIQNPIRERKRDALVAYLIASEDPNHRCIKEPNDLYDRLLIDTQMCACMPTSRIVQAHAVVQLFAQRCLMGQEPAVDPRADAIEQSGRDDWKEWKWMKNFRVWEANRKIFLYPENWIEADLRDDKSQFFKEFEQTLLQGDVTDANVEIAARTYLDRLDDSAFMEVVAAHYQDTAFYDKEKSEGRVLHVVARTKGGDPPVYYYRRFVDEKRWTPWESIDVDIATDHLLLFIRNSRLTIAWPVFTDVVNEDAEIEVPRQGSGKKPVPQFPRGWSVQLAVSERSNGRWQPKRVSKDCFTTTMTKTTAEKMTGLRKRCRFFVLDREPRGYFVPAEDKPEIGFFVTAYAFLPTTPDADLDGNMPTEPWLIGAFNLAGCKGYPEVVNKRDLNKLKAEVSSITVPRIRDAELTMQRWTELGVDKTNDLVIDGLLGSSHHPTTVFRRTPGVFKVTTVQQQTVVDRAAVDALRLANFTLDGWKPGGMMAPFFYEDGRRGYVAVPLLRSGDNQGIEADEAISGLAEHLSLLAPGLRAAVARQKTWPELEAKWNAKDDTRNAYTEVTALLKRKFRLEFHAFYHPFVCLMKRVLAAGGFEALMRTSSLRWDRSQEPVDPNDPWKGEPLPGGGPPATVDEFERVFGPGPVVLKPYPNETAEFNFDPINGYADYNWEVFYHVPSLVSQKLVTGQKFEDALRWFHFVFNPTGVPSRVEGLADPGNEPSILGGVSRYWMTKPFQIRSERDNDTDWDSYVGQRIETILTFLGDPSNPNVAEHWQKQVSEWRRNPFIPHQVARGRTVAFQKATFMRYLDALIAWGDFLFKQDTRESVNEALQLYITAERLLGPKPRVVKAPGKSSARTYRELEALICGEATGIDGFGNSLVELENLLPPQSSKPCPSDPCMSPLPVGALLAVPYFCIPRNEKLMGYWATIEDRLYKIRHCQNIEGVERQLALFAPPIDPGLLVRAFASGLTIGDVLAQGAGQVPLYRFHVLSQKASELTQMVISLGNALLQAIEKKDAEALARLRSTHEIALLKMVRDIKLKQVREANENLAALNRSKATTEHRRNFYRDIKYTTKQEEKAMDLSDEAMTWEELGLGFNTAASLLHILGQFDIGGWGFGGAPGAQYSSGGNFYADAASAVGQFFSGMGGLKRSGSGAVSVKAGYERRFQDWKLQEQLADRELKQIEKQIAAAEIRVEITKDELRNHEKQTEQAEQVLAFMKDRKFTNQELYEWMIGQISATYFQAWQMAHRFTLRVERAFHFELGPRNTNGEFDQYVRFDCWDSLHKGLLAGEKLLFDLKRMEVDYLERNKRDFEITKHISLSRLDPLALLRLKSTAANGGKCEINLSEWLFDMDYPGHYFRRIKSVSLSIPCVVGPHAGVNCTLTLTKSIIRIKPEVKADDLEADELNLLRNYSRIQSIATSGAQNDSGLFEVNFRDDRYLPFEGAGAASTWTLELRRDDNRQIDFDSISDVILHVKYTSRFGGAAFQNARRAAADNWWKEGTPDANVSDKVVPSIRRLFFLRDEFPAEWAKFNAEEGEGARVLTLSHLHARLPYVWNASFASAARPKLYDEKGIEMEYELEVDGQGISDQEPSIELRADTQWKLKLTCKPLANLFLLVETNLRSQ